VAADEADPYLPLDLDAERRRGGTGARRKEDATVGRGGHQTQPRVRSSKDAPPRRCPSSTRGLGVHPSCAAPSSRPRRPSFAAGKRKAGTSPRAPVEPGTPSSPLEATSPPLLEAAQQHCAAASEREGRVPRAPPVREGSHPGR
jgi:hypothetical protein